MAIYQYDTRDTTPNIAENFLAGMSTMSNLKTAKLNQDKKENALKKEDAGRKLRENALNVAKNTKEKKMLDDGGNVNEIKTLDYKELNRLNSLAPEVGEKIKENDRLEKVKSIRKSRYIKQGMSEEQAEISSNATIKELQDLETWSKTASENEQKEATIIIHEVSSNINNIMSLPADEQEKAYSTALNELNDEISKSINDGNSKNTKTFQGIKNSLPSKWQGNSWATDYLMTQTQKFDILKTKQKQDFEKKQATIKFGREKEMEGIKSDNALLKQGKVNEGKGGSNSAKTSQYQKDFTAREKQINSIMSGANIMNTRDKDKSLKEAGNQLTVALGAFKRGDPQGYAIQFGDRDPLNEISIREKEVKKNTSDIYPDGFYSLEKVQQEKWKDIYVTTGKKLPLKVNKGGIFSDDKISLENKPSSKKVKEQKTSYNIGDTYNNSKITKTGTVKGRKVIVLENGKRYFI